jgi:hypothetical protein
MPTCIVDDETINKIVSYLYAKAVGHDTSIISIGLVRMGFDLSDNTDHAERLANSMFDLNLVAVQAQYGEAEGEGFPLPVFKYLFTPASQIEVIKALECWKYQCTKGYVPKTKLYKAMAQTHCLLCSDYIHQLDEYENAPWG